MRKKICESKEINRIWHVACDLLQACLIFIFAFSFCVSGCTDKNFDHNSKFTKVFKNPARENS
jgi:hypothetical protein